MTITSRNPSFTLTPESENIHNLHANIGDLKCFFITSSDQSSAYDDVSYKTLVQLERSNFDYCIENLEGGKQKSGLFPMPG